YGPNSGVGLAFEALHDSRGPLRVAVIGLGAGVLASYCQPRDAFTFYEIDPIIDRVAHQHFSFLRQCKSEVVLGDARLTLGAREPQAYDLMVLDAFSGDAIPVHLLTREALATFARHSQPGGCIAR